MLSMRNLRAFLHLLQDRAGRFARLTPIHGISYVFSARKVFAIPAATLLILFLFLTVKETMQTVWSAEQSTLIEMSLESPISLENDSFLCITFPHQVLEKYLAYRSVDSVRIDEVAFLVARLALLASIYRSEETLLKNTNASDIDLNNLLLVKKANFGTNLQFRSKFPNSNVPRILADIANESIALLRETVAISVCNLIAPKFWRIPSIHIRSVLVIDTKEICNHEAFIPSYGTTYSGDCFNDDILSGFAVKLKFKIPQQSQNPLDRIDKLTLRIQSKTLPVIFKYEVVNNRRGLHLGWSSLSNFGRAKRIQLNSMMHISKPINSSCTERSTMIICQHECGLEFMEKLCECNLLSYGFSGYNQSCVERYKAEKLALFNPRKCLEMKMHLAKSLRWKFKDCIKKCTQPCRHYILVPNFQLRTRRGRDVLLSVHFTKSFAVIFREYYSIDTSALVYSIGGTLGSLN